MRIAVLSAVTTLALWLCLQSAAAACKCVAPDPLHSYDSADHVVHVRVLGQVFAPAGKRRYLALTIGEAFKGCLPEQSLVLLQSNSASSACGVSFRFGGEQLVHAADGGRSFGLHVLETSACAGDRAWDELDSDYHAFLATRCTSCGGRACQCVDSEPVQCLVDPCSVSHCDVEGAQCASNYCGGCNAEWTAPNGARVCTGSDSQCDDPRRNYLSHDASECAAIDFLCGEGQTRFLDACGCGCASDPVVAPCRRGGCSNELCLGPTDEPQVSPCVFRPEFACYQRARCEPQSSGACGFTETPDLLMCLSAADGGTR